MSKGSTLLGQPSCESSYLEVRGEVKQPGRQLYTGRITLARAIESAGGLTAAANHKARDNPSCQRSDRVVCLRPDTETGGPTIQRSGQVTPCTCRRRSLFGIRIIEAAQVDKPKTRRRLRATPAQIKQRKQASLRRLAKEVGWKIQKP